MRFMIGFVGGWLALLLLCGCAHNGLVAEAPNGVAEEFVGSTPGEALVKEFIGGLASDAQCHCVAWQLTLLTNEHTGRPSSFRLAAQYQVPTRSNPNRSEDGPKVSLDGAWEILKGARSRPEAVVYRLHSSGAGVSPATGASHPSLFAGVTPAGHRPEARATDSQARPQRSLSFVKVGENLLHLLNLNESLAVGNGGWSYTLNSAAHAEKPNDLAAALNGSAPEMSYKISPMATGPTVFGVFEGRTPCHGISRELKRPQHAGCIKSKWRVTLFKNPETSAPTTYKVEGSQFREGAREGTWQLVRGATTDASATVYQLSATETQPALLLMKGDENVLFFLDQKRAPLVGHGEFSYTLNRVAAKEATALGPHFVP